MATEEALIRTADGECRTAVFTPGTGTGPWPPVIFYTDGLGIRPTLHDMGRRLAEAGFATETELSPHLLVDEIRGRIYIGAADHRVTR